MRQERQPLEPFDIGPGPSGWPVPGRGRLDNVDLVRGVIMVLMALDHVRDFFHVGRFGDPLDLQNASAALFLTRWVTHYCAPNFVFLAGVGAFLYGARGRSKSDLSLFLLTRGFWLILLELTLVRMGWTFHLWDDFLVGQVIWATGWSMVILSALVFLPLEAVGVLGLAMIVGHNALDRVEPQDFGELAWLWQVLHVQSVVDLPGGMKFAAGYPLIPWIGVLAAGYAFGPQLLRPRDVRRKTLAGIGLGLIALFLAVRGLNVYGDPHPWEWQETAGRSVLALVKCEKYPPSLCYLLMTIGPGVLALAAFDFRVGPVGRFFVTFGRVPMFYYLLHVPLIHGLAAAWAYWQYGDQVFEWTPETMPKDAGFDLPGTYLWWVIVVALLYPPCAWFARVKERRKDWWLSYF